jgi:flagellar biosynthesis protein FlhB
MPGGSALVRLLVLPPLAALIASFVFGFAQTRFLFRPASLALNWNRIYSVDYHPMHVFGRALGAMLLGTGAIGAGLGAAAFLQRDLLALLNSNPRYAPQWGAELVVALLPVLLVAAFAILAIWWGISRVLFLRAHRMTRREALHYQRED